MSDWVGATRGSGNVWLEKLKRHPLPSDYEISGCKMSAQGIPDVKCRSTDFQMWNVGARNSSRVGLSYVAQGGPSACARCRDPSPEWHEVRKAIRINSIRIPQEDMWRAPLSGLPHDTREHHTQTIAYPIRICCPDGKHWLKWACLATAHVPPPSDGVSERPIWTSLPWIPKNSPQSLIALVIKKLSKHQNLTQFD